jgi:integrase
MAYYAIRHRPHRTMTELEQAKLLKVTGEHARGFRDHVLFALALGTGLREHEALALDVGDITEDGTTIKRRISLRVFKRCTKRPAPQEIFLPDSLHHKLGRLLAWKKRRGESLVPDAPLFISREGNRLSMRMARTAFRRWQRAIARLVERPSRDEARYFRGASWSSTGLPSGSSTRICLPPGPTSIAYLVYFDDVNTGLLSIVRPQDTANADYVRFSVVSRPVGWSPN